MIWSLKNTEPGAFVGHPDLQNTWLMLKVQLLERFPQIINHISAFLRFSPSLSAIPGDYFSWSCLSSAAWPGPLTHTHSSLHPYPSMQIRRSAAVESTAQGFSLLCVCLDVQFGVLTKDGYQASNQVCIQTMHCELQLCRCAANVKY